MQCVPGVVQKSARLPTRGSVSMNLSRSRAPGQYSCSAQLQRNCNSASCLRQRYWGRPGGKALEATELKSWGGAFRVCQHRAIAVRLWVQATSSKASHSFSTFRILHNQSRQYINHWLDDHFSACNIQTRFGSYLRVHVFQR